MRKVYHNIFIWIGENGCVKTTGAFSSSLVACRLEWNGVIWRACAAYGTGGCGAMSQNRNQDFFHALKTLPILDSIWLAGFKRLRTMPKPEIDFPLAPISHPLKSHAFRPLLSGLSVTHNRPMLTQVTRDPIGGWRNLIYGRVIIVAIMAWWGEKEEGGWFWPNWSGPVCWYQHF